MRLKKILTKKPTTITSNILNFNISFTDEEETFTYSVDIPDEYLILNYGERRIKKYIKDTLYNTYGYVASDTEIDGTFYTTFLANLTTILNNKYAYKWSQALRLMYIHFEPQDNVFEDTVVTNEYGERVKTDVEGEKTTTNLYGESEQTNTHGQKVTTNVYGETETTNEYGERVSTNAYGENTTDNVEQTNPFNDSGVLYDKNKNTITENEHTDTTTNNTYTDTINNVEHTDTLTDSEHTDTINNAERTDTITSGESTNTSTDGSHTDTTTTYRHGNIGVTTTISMFNEFQEYLKNYSNIWDLIINDVLNDICGGY